MSEDQKGEVRAHRRRSTRAQQLDAFTGRDLRGAARQLDLFGELPPPDPVDPPDSPDA